MLFLAKWPNGDFSIVFAKDQHEAFVALDEVEDPGEATFTAINEKHVVMTFKTTSPDSETGQMYRLESLGEDLEEFLESHGVKLSAEEEEQSVDR